jgi:nitroreductase
VDVLEAIHTRRTIKAYRPDPVPRSLIEQVIEAAVWAPNHRLTEPWQFVVLQGAALERLAALRREQTAMGLRAEGKLSEEQIARIAEEGFQKALAAPVTVAVLMHEHPDPAIREEDYAATAAAIQNLMLAARGLGLGAFWSTNRVIGYAPARELIGAGDSDRVVGLVQLGYPAQERRSNRAPASARTRWLS